MSDSQGQHRQWHFDWRLLVFSGVFLPILIGLGVWQLNRAEEKQLLLNQWQQEAENRAWQDMESGDLTRGRPLTLTGMYGSRNWLLDNRTRDGIPGYEVLTEFRPLEGPPVVVNRGWVQAPRTRDQLPQLETPEGIFTLEGRLSDYPVPPVLVDQRSVALAGTESVRRGRTKGDSGSSRQNSKAFRQSPAGRLPGGLGTGPDGATNPLRICHAMVCAGRGADYIDYSGELPKDRSQ